MARANEYTAGGSAPQPDKDQTARPGLAGILHTMHAPSLVLHNYMLVPTGYR